MGGGGEGIDDIRPAKEGGGREKTHFSPTDETD